MASPTVVPRALLPMALGVLMSMMVASRPLKGPVWIITFWDLANSLRWAAIHSSRSTRSTSSRKSRRATWKISISCCGTIANWRVRLTRRSAASRLSLSMSIASMGFALRKTNRLMADVSVGRSSVLSVGL